MMTLYSNILNNTGVDSTSLVSWSDAFYSWMETTTDATALPLIDDGTVLCYKNIMNSIYTW